MMIDGRKYVMIDRRFGRLCEFDPGILHGQTPDLFWIDITDQPDITLDWTWEAMDGAPDGKFVPPKPPQVRVETIDYGARDYAFDAGAGLNMHMHPNGKTHDHIVKTGATIVIVKGRSPILCQAGDAAIVLPPDLPHAIYATEDGTTFVNTLIA